MKKLSQFLRNDEDGSIIIIVALSMSFTLLFAAFVTDFGFAYVKASDAQNAADAATLAAAQLLPVDPDNPADVTRVYDKAIEYANKNGAPAITEGDIILGNLIWGRYTSVKVNIPREVELNFAKIIGINTLNVSRSASAKIVPCTSIQGAAPLSVEYEQLMSAIESGNTEHICLKYGAGDGEQGAYGAIDLDGVMGGGASDFTAWLEFGYNGVISVGEDLLPVEKGNMTGPTSSAISERYNACTHYQDDGGCCAGHYEMDCARILKVLVVEKIGKSYVKVKGFAAFVIEGESAGDEVTGSYIKFIEPGGKSDDNNAWSTSDFGLFNVSLSS